jgi:hypothetical protein
MLTVVCETPVSHGRESGKTQPFEAPAILDHRDRRGFVIFAAGDLVPGLASWNRARVPGCILVTFALYPLSGTISHSHGLRRDRSPFSRRVMDHRGVADRCPICVHTIRHAREESLGSMILTDIDKADIG